MAKDLGTYHVRVEFEDGDGFIYKWDTGGRYSDGNESYHPLSAFYISPAWDDEDDLLGAIWWQFVEGNYNCDCNKLLFLDRAHQREAEDYPCGDTMKIKTLTMIRPDRTEIPIEID
jgi:hypothetical protein